MEIPNVLWTSACWVKPRSVNCLSATVIFSNRLHFKKSSEQLHRFQGLYKAYERQYAWASLAATNAERLEFLFQDPVNLERTTSMDSNPQRPKKCYLPVS